MKSLKLSANASASLYDVSLGVRVEKVGRGLRIVLMTGVAFGAAPTHATFWESEGSENISCAVGFAAFHHRSDARRMFDGRLSLGENDPKAARYLGEISGVPQLEPTRPAMAHFVEHVKPGHSVYLISGMLFAYNKDALYPYYQIDQSLYTQVLELLGMQPEELNRFILERRLHPWFPIATTELWTFLSDLGNHWKETGPRHFVMERELEFVPDPIRYPGTFRFKLLLYFDLATEVYHIQFQSLADPNQELDVKPSFMVRDFANFMHRKYVGPHQEEVNRLFALIPGKQIRIFYRTRDREMFQEMMRTFYQLIKPHLLY